MTLTINHRPQIIDSYDINTIFYQSKPISMVNVSGRQLWIENDLIRAMGITEKYIEQFLKLNPYVANWIQQMSIPEISPIKQKVWRVEAVYWLAATRNKFFLWEDFMHFIYEQRHPFWWQGQFKTVLHGEYRQIRYSDMKLSFYEYKGISTWVGTDILEALNLKVTSKISGSLRLPQQWKIVSNPPHCYPTTLAEPGVVKLLRRSSSPNRFGLMEFLIEQSRSDV